MLRGRIVRLSEDEAQALRARQVAEAELAAAKAADWSAVQEATAPAKVAISMRIDEDVLAFFRKAGPGYQTRINAVLRSYMVAKTARRKQGRGVSP